MSPYIRHSQHYRSIKAVITLQRLQSVLNAAARLVFSARRSEHITPLLRELHWLKVPERIQFRLCVLTHRCLHGTAQLYLAETLQSTADVQEHRRLRSASTSRLVVPATRRATIPMPGIPFRQGNPVTTTCVPQEIENDSVRHLFFSFFVIYCICVKCPEHSYCDSVT